MTQVAQHLEDQAYNPPIVYYEKFIDPWTVAPLLQVYTDIRTRQANPRLTISDMLDYLLIQPVYWDDFINGVLRIQRERYGNQMGDSESERLFSRIIDCAVTWERMLSANKIDRAILMIRQVVDVSWTDEYVVQGCLSLPRWYSKPVGG